jgi:hypothetical protein
MCILFLKLLNHNIELHAITKISNFVNTFGHDWKSRTYLTVNKR